MGKPTRGLTSFLSAHSSSPSTWLLGLKAFPAGPLPQHALASHPRVSTASLGPRLSQTLWGTDIPRVH
jgi:hypothetical protein